MKESVVIVAGGIGERMKSNLPKQLLSVGGKTILEYTIERFLQYNSKINIILVLHDSIFDLWDKIQSENSLMSNIIATKGGKERYDSVKNGLNLLNDDTGIVGIHDAARPLVSIQTIENCFNTAREKGNAIPVIPLSESLRKIDAENSCSVNRAEYRLVQTPQCFRIKEIKSAYETPFDPFFTDDASLFEQSGGKINLVVGNQENIKITNPVDLDYLAFHLDRLKQ